ncbi:MAG: aryl-sulfate sulfotransferase [bacterium]
MNNRKLPIVIAGFALAALAAGQAYDGLTLYNPMMSRNARLITNDGQAVNTWYCNSNPAYMPYLMPDSTMWRPGVYSAASLRPAAYGGLIERYSWDGDVIQSFTWSGANYIQHHDIQPMPNGNILVVSVDRYTRAEAQALGRVSISGSYIWSEMIVEYDPVADSVVWAWRVWDHLVQNVDPAKPNYGVISEYPGRLDINVGAVQFQGDWIHVNAVDYWEEEDLIVFCSHYLHELYVIDHSTTTEEARGSTGGRHGRGGDFLYRWGNPQNYGRGTSEDRHFYVVHGANWIQPGLPGAGNILVFNNGDRPGSANDYSVVEEITPPRDSLGGFHIHSDSAFGPAEPTWFYQNPGAFYSNHLSGAFRMPNGNTFMIEGTSGRMTEVTAEKQVVWQYNIGSQTGRAIKYPRDYVVGVEAERPAPHAARPPHATIARGRLFLPGEGGRAELLDAAGRRVMVLASGANDVSRLAPGVYFVRAGGPAGATRVVLAR